MPDPIHNLTIRNAAEALTLDKKACEATAHSRLPNPHVTIGHAWSIPSPIQKPIREQNRAAQHDQQQQ